MPPKKAIKVSSKEAQNDQIVYQFEYRNGSKAKRSLTDLDQAQMQLVQKWEVEHLGKQQAKSDKSESPQKTPEPRAKRGRKKKQESQSLGTRRTQEDEGKKKVEPKVESKAEGKVESKVARLRRNGLSSSSSSESEEEKKEKETEKLRKKSPVRMSSSSYKTREGKG